MHKLIWQCWAEIKKLQAQLDGLAASITSLSARLFQFTAGMPYKFTVGSGSPEGVVNGDVGHLFWDDTNKFLYIKIIGNATTTGWQVH